MSNVRTVMVLLSLGAVYYIALGIMPSITYRLPIMELAGWLGANQTTASYAYLVGTHTIGVFLAALPIAIAFALLMSGHSIWLSLVVSLPPILDLVFGFWMFTGIDYVADQSLKLIVFYLTDALKIALTVPFLAWLISKYAPERRRTASA